MNVQFVNTTSSKLNSLSISNGQLIALSDRAGLYYDINNTRRNVTPVTLSDSYTASSGSANSRVGASSFAVAASHNTLLNKLDSKIYVLGSYDYSGTGDANAIMYTIPLKKGWNYIFPTCYEKISGADAGDFVFSTDLTKWWRFGQWTRFTLFQDQDIQLITGTSGAVNVIGIQCLVLHHDFE